MTETRFYEPARMSTPSKPLFSLKPLDTTAWLRSSVKTRMICVMMRAR